MNANQDSRNDDQNRSSNAGWIAGLLVIIAVLAVGGAFWFTYHP